MYTRCTGCHTTHPVNASLLAQAGGKYRCGKCQKTGNALESLFDQWPAAGDRPPSAGAMPVLGLSIDLEQAKESRLEPAEAALEGAAGGTQPGPSKIRQWLTGYSWVAIAIILALFIIVEYAAFKEKPFSELPWVNSLMIRVGLREPPANPGFRALDQIQLVSRELKSHPLMADTLQLNATIVNQARWSQPYPDIEVVLLDVAGTRVNRLRFTPSDYLAKGAAGKSRMRSGAFLPLSLDLPDPGRQAVGFELEFR